MPATPQYHVLVDGQGYLIDPTSYHRKPATTFAAKLQVGDTTYASLVGTAAWAQTSWVDGVFEGSQEFDRATKANRVADAASVDISYGDVRLGRPLTQVFSTEPIVGLAAFNGVLYAAATNSGNIYKSTDGATWSLAVNLNSVSAVTALSCILSTAFGLYVGAANSAKIFRFNGTAWDLYSDNAFTSAGNPEVAVATTALSSLYLPNGAGWADTMTPTIVAAWTMHDPALTPVYRSGVGAINEAGPFGGPPTGSQLSVLLPYPRVDVIALGHDDLFIGASDNRNGLNGELLSWNGKLWNAGFSVRSLSRRDDNGVASITRFRGSPYAGSLTQGRVWNTTNDDLVRFFTLPELAMTGTPPSYTKPVRTLAIADERFYAAYNDVLGLSLWQYDGTGWARYAVGAAADPYDMASFLGAIFVAAGSGIFRAPQTYAPSGWLKTPWFDADLASIDKALAHLTLTFAPLTTGQQVAVDFAVDDGTAFTALGTANTVGQQTATFAFPSGAHGKRVQLRYTLTSSVPTTTPKLRSTVLEYQLVTTGADGLPGVRNEYVFDPLLEGTRQLPLMRLDRSEEPLTGAQLRQALWASKGKSSTITFVDTDGSTHTVWFADLEDHLIREREVATRQGWRGSVRLVEA